MGIILDLIVIGIIALFTFLGYKQGLVKAAIKILSFFIAIIVALIIYKPISGIIVKNTGIDDNIKNAIMEKIGSQEEEVQIEDNLTNKIVGEVNSTVDELATAFSVKLIEVMTLLIIYILIKIALKFITALADLITKLPLIKQVNKLRAEYYMV